MISPPPLPTQTGTEGIYCRWVTACLVALQSGNAPGFLTLKKTRPRRPRGVGYEAQLAQFYYDRIMRYNPTEARDVYVSKTTRGIIHRAR